ncbi:M50 family metallopeptidase [Thalassotalea psychrophila]|uniref:M50 family metallopeptidase n=1 Tax=Thalassotalea psychrophila TaxID=3065647 RepID=A0ABY9TQV4_9GAMM|nr:M50 family metallopeptidase [Colwelliaceae bacterium SQ149]
MVIAFVLKETPYLGIPFNWLESFFHELSHGLAAIVTGGKILQIELFPNGAGLCTTQGGIALIIAFSGYAGAVGWGVLIFKIADLKSSISRYFSLFIVLLLAMSCLLWVRDLLTLVIILILIATFALSIKISHFNFLPVILKLFALMVLLNSLSSPLYLIDGRGIGDGSALADITFIPEIIWILIWSAIGIYSIFKLSKK